LSGYFKRNKLFAHEKDPHCRKARAQPKPEAR
jgi:hypothetical protein